MIHCALFYPRRNLLKPVSVMTNVVDLQTDSVDQVGLNSSANVARRRCLQTEVVAVTEMVFRS